MYRYIIAVDNISNEIQNENLLNTLTLYNAIGITDNCGSSDISSDIFQ